MPIVKDVPGVGRVEFADEAAALKFEQQAGFGGGAGGPFEQTIGQKLERMFDVGREALVSGAGRALSTVSPTLNIAEQVGLIDPGTTERLGSGAANLLLPESIPELAGEAAIALTTGGASIPGQVARRFAARTLIPPAVAATTAALTGTESPAGAAAKTAIGTFLPEAAGGVKRGVQNVAKAIATRGRIRAQGLKDVAAVSKALIKDVPVFRKILEVAGTPRAAGKLNVLTDPQNGLRALRDQFDEFDDIAVKAFKGKQIDFPFEARLRGDLTGAPGLPAVTKLNIKDAINEVRRLKEVARNALPGVQTKPLRDAAREAEDVLKQSLFDVDPKLLTRYEKAVEEFGKGRGILDILKESDAITGDEVTGFIDLGKLAAFMSTAKNIARFPESSVSALFKAARRGAPIGARDIATQFTARGFIPRTPATPLGGAASFGIPIARRAGERSISMFEATGPQLLADVIGTRALFGGIPSKRVRESRERKKLQSSPIAIEIQ